MIPLGVHMRYIDLWLYADIFICIHGIASSAIYLGFLSLLFRSQCRCAATTACQVPSTAQDLEDVSVFPEVDDMQTVVPDMIISSIDLVPVSRLRCREWRVEGFSCHSFSQILFTVIHIQGMRSYFGYWYPLFLSLQVSVMTL